MNFDYLRLFFAVTVMTFHIGYDELQWRPLWTSEMAVLGFFCISGFLITQSFLRDPDLGRYAVKRFARIYPPIMITVVILVGAGLALSLGQPFVRGASALLFFQDWLPLTANGYAIYGHGAFWTLVIELQFYVAVPMIIWCWRRWPLRTVTVLLIVAIVAHYYRRFMPVDPAMLAYRQSIFTVAHYFVAGMLAAIYVPKIAETRWFWVALIAPSVALYAYLQLHGDQILTHLMPIALMAIIIGLARLSAFAGRAAPWGDISYGVYIYHFPVMTIFGQVGAGGQRLSIMLVTVGLSLASWHLIEKPIISLARGNHQTGRSTQPRMPSRRSSPENVPLEKVI